MGIRRWLLVGEVWLTYVNCGITSHKGKHRADQANKERQSLGRPATFIDKLSEDVLGGANVGQRDEWDEDGEEAENVDHKDKSLELGKDTATDHVNTDGEGDDGPEEQGRMP
jgi:hypothetical protein